LDNIWIANDIASCIDNQDRSTTQDTQPLRKKCIDVSKTFEEFDICKILEQLRWKTLDLGEITGLQDH
jgi:hypothetical protein